MTNLETLEERLFSKIKAGSIRVLQEFYKKRKNNQLEKDFNIFIENCKYVSQTCHQFEFFLIQCPFLNS